MPLLGARCDFLLALKQIQRNPSLPKAQVQPCCPHPHLLCDLMSPAGPSAELVRVHWVTLPAEPWFPDGQPPTAPPPSRLLLLQELRFPAAHPQLPSPLQTPPRPPAEPACLSSHVAASTLATPTQVTSKVTAMASDSLSAASTPLRPLHTNAKVESSPIRLQPIPLLTQLKGRMLTRVLSARSNPVPGITRAHLRGVEPTLSCTWCLLPQTSMWCLSLPLLGLPGEGRSDSPSCREPSTPPVGSLCPSCPVPPGEPSFLRAGLSGVPRVFFRGCLCHRIQVPIHVCGVGFCDTSRVSESSTRF